MSAPDALGGAPATEAPARERPILFSAPMVRAILEGRKTVTRRIVKPMPPSPDAVYAKASTAFHYFTDRHTPGVFRVAGPVWAVRELGGPTEIRCPFGVPGDRLWVRETWIQADPKCDPAKVWYRADYPPADGSTWKPSIHMPRWASRLSLEVTAVSVERLHDVTEIDAAREGVTPFPEDPEGDCWTDGKHRTAFEHLWNEINGWEPNAWAANPWVWRVEFKRATHRISVAEGKEKR